MGRRKRLKLIKQTYNSIFEMSNDGPTINFRKTLINKDTLDGNYVGLEGYGPPRLKKIEAFWERLAVPTVWET